MNRTGIVWFFITAAILSAAFSCIVLAIVMALAPPTFNRTDYQLPLLEAFDE
jgi:hypothetical protein